MTSCLCIGDPHFKPENKFETDLMKAFILEHVKAYQPRFIVVLGDILHSFEKIDLASLARAIDFLRELRPLSRHLYVLIGNHDRPNNRTFLTEEHPLTALKEWPATSVVDRPLLEVIDGFKFVFVPYVAPGRFEEALGTIGLQSPYLGIEAIFAHQEFAGAKMNAITSNAGDKWPLDFPLCVSGHIHDYDEPQPNIIYPGTPIYHAYGLPSALSQTVSLFHFGGPSPSQVRLPLLIPYKLAITLTPAELATYEPPPSARIRIKVIGEPEALRAVVQLPHVKALLESGIKIKTVIRKADPLIPLNLLRPVRQTSFLERLNISLHQEPEPVRATFTLLFG